MHPLVMYCAMCMHKFNAMTQSLIKIQVDVSQISKIFFIEICYENGKETCSKILNLNFLGKCLLFQNVNTTNEFEKFTKFFDEIQKAVYLCCTLCKYLTNNVIYAKQKMHHPISCWQIRNESMKNKNSSEGAVI